MIYIYIYTESNFRILHSVYNCKVELGVKVGVGPDIMTFEVANISFIEHPKRHQGLWRRGQRRHPAREIGGEKLDPQIYLLYYLAYLILKVNSQEVNASI